MYSLRLFLAFTVLGLCLCQDAIKLTLYKEYPNGERILSNSGQFLDNAAYWDQINKRQYVKATNEYNLLYYSNLYFWEDNSQYPFKMQFIMDTGSSWIWVPAEGCKGCPSDDALPQRFIAHGDLGTKTIKYGSGSVSGDIVTSEVSLAPVRGSGVKGYKFLAINNADLPGFSRSRWDGLVGLLPTSISGSDLFVSGIFECNKIFRVVQIRSYS